MAAVYKRGRTWWVRLTWHGQEIRRSARTPSKAVAQQYLAQLVEEHRRLDRGGRPRHTFDEAVERFVGEHLPSLKPLAARRYLFSIKMLAPHFTQSYLDEVTKTKILHYIGVRKKQGISPSTIRRDLACLSSMLQLAISWEWMDANPIRTLDRRLLKEGDPRRRYLSHEEQERLLVAAGSYLKPMIVFAIETGLRLEEQLSLEWSQVNQRRQELTLTKTKTSNPRVVPLTDKAAQILAQQPRHLTSPYVFCKPDGSRYLRLTRGLDGAASRAGIADLRWHDLRRTCGCRLLQDYGMDLYRVSKWLGHKSVAMTERAYAFLRVEDLHAVIRPGTKVGTGNED